MHSIVKRRRKTRNGKGFSQNELKQVGLNLKQARKLGIPIDSRRSTTHTENVKTLKSHLRKTVPTHTVPIDLIVVAGIGEKRASQLKALGIATITKLATVNPKETAKKLNISEMTVSKWIKNANKIKSNKRKNKE
jgi:predicted flap endonuclease-1-like 5' DNA nuclease